MFTVIVIQARELILLMYKTEFNRSSKSKHPMMAQTSSPRVIIGSFVACPQPKDIKIYKDYILRELYNIIAPALATQVVRLNI